MAYISAIAAHAGFWVEEPKVDLDSIDGEICSRKKRRGGVIHFQAKASSGLEFNTKTGLMAFSLPKKNYDDLREESICPSILIVMRLPDNIPDWVLANDDEALLKYSAYWLDLTGYAASGNETSVTVYIPKTNRLTKEVLVIMMRKALNLPDEPIPPAGDNLSVEEVIQIEGEVAPVNAEALASEAA